MAQTTPDASLDAEIELKKRARRRLVGAAALALLAAVVLPMVMDHEPKPGGQEIQVRIPSQEAGGFSSRILPNKPSATPLPPAESKPAAAEPAPAKESKPEPPKAEVAPAPEAKAEAKAVVAAKAEPKPEPAKAAPPAAKAEKPVAKGEEARAAAALAGGEQWVVQLGAYKEAGNVKTLAAKLKQLGLPAYTENFDSPAGQRTRVRAGPFASREAAEKAKARIKTIGVDGPVAPK